MVIHRPNNPDAVQCAVNLLLTISDYPGLALRRVSMKVSRCVTRNFGGGTGRICLKLEPEFWTMLGEICDREGVEMTTLLRGMEGGCHPDNRASAVREIGRAHV